MNKHMRCMFKKALITISVCVLINFINAQPFIGQREVINFTKQQYNAGTQNWKIVQDKLGRIYFANNEGVLSYDGTHWRNNPLPNKTIVWSIDFGKDQKLYAGGQDEFGYFAPDNDGLVKFTSLKPLLDENDQKFADIWNVISYENDIFFNPIPNCSGITITQLLLFNPGLPGYF